jgi:Peptidase A4 family
MQRATPFIVVGIVGALACAACGGGGHRAASTAARTTAALATPPLRTGGTFAAAEVSSNWAGYVLRPTAAAHGRTFSSARGTWRMPSIACSPGAGSSAAFWVGIGGYGASSPSLEQLGASADCSPSGVASYRAWTEIVPAPARFLSLKVAPGDTMLASVAVSRRKVSFVLQNLSRGTRYTTSTNVAHALDTRSAEWIAEAPSLCLTASQCEVVPLSSFGTVTFSNASVAAGTHLGRLLDPFWATTPVVLVSSAGASGYIAATNPAGAVPRHIASSERAFTVAFSANVGGTPPSSPLLGAPLPPWIH